MTDDKVYICRACGLGFSDKDKAFDCCEGVVVVMAPSDGTIYNFRYTAETASDDFTRAMRDAGWHQMFEGALFSDGNTYWLRRGKAVTDDAAREHWRDTGNTPPPF